MPSERGVFPKVIILSAYSEFSYAQQAIKLGVSEYLIKPIMINELTQSLRAVEQQLKAEAEKDGWIPELYPWRRYSWDFRTDG